MDFPAIVHFALSQKAIIAKCTVGTTKHSLNLLIYNDLFYIFAWHKACSIRRKNSPTKSSKSEGAMMNVVLSFLNAAALVALVTFHFMGDSGETEQVNVLTPPLHSAHQAPQLAILNHLSQNRAMLAKDSDEAAQVSVDRSERWVF